MNRRVTRSLRMRRFTRAATTYMKSNPNSGVPVGFHFRCKNLTGRVSHLVYAVPFWYNAWQFWGYKSILYPSGPPLNQNLYRHYSPCAFYGVSRTINIRRSHYAASGRVRIARSVYSVCTVLKNGLEFSSPAMLRVLSANKFLHTARIE